MVMTGYPGEMPCMGTMPSLHMGQITFSSGVGYQAITGTFPGAWLLCSGIIMVDGCEKGENQKIRTLQPPFWQDLPSKP
jgi:hypothetical protein